MQRPHSRCQQGHTNPPQPRTAHFSERGYGEVRAAYGSLLFPLFEKDGLRMGELARRARLAKQTMTTMIRLLEREGLVRRELAPAREVFAYLSEIENLPQWATEFARELHRDQAGYKVVNNLGELRFEIHADERIGVIDMFAGPTTEDMAVFPTRAVKLPDGRTAYSVTMFQAPEMPEDLLEGQYESLKREFANIEARFE